MRVGESYVVQRLFSVQFLGWDMIYSNSFVAETIYSSFRESALLRIHSNASVENFEELEQSSIKSRKIMKCVKTKNV